jgi:micrococcal nuclease
LTLTICRNLFLLMVIPNPIPFAGLFTLLAAMPAVAETVRDVIEGPVSAEIVRVVDGDTILVDATPWPQQTVEVYVRLRGIDAPELHSKCQEVRVAAAKAQEALEEMLPAIGQVQLTHISGDKYFGRILADITTEDGLNPAADLLRDGYVTRYDGGRKPVSRCAGGE